MGLAELIDLERGWALTRHDIKHRNFVRMRLESRLAELDQTSWLEELNSRIQTDQYEPSSATIVESPKGGGLVRPGMHLCLEDQVVFSACVYALIGDIESAVEPCKALDCSYPFRDDGMSIFPSGNLSWGDFRIRSKELLAGNAGFTHCVVADVTACYENIDLNLLSSDLRDIGAAEPIIRMLLKCLKRWAPIHRGLPQGHSAADALAKLYLTRIDEQLQAGGLIHRRYVDDVRIFCTSEDEAKMAMVELAAVLRGRGLNLQSAKSKILDRESSLKEIDGSITVIEGAKDNLVARLVEVSAMVGPYADNSEIDYLLENDPADTPDVLESAFDHLIVDCSILDKSLFHLLLSRLGNARESHAVGFCMGILSSHPEETETILDYLVQVECFEGQAGRLASFVAAEGSYVYPFQIHQIMRTAITTGPTAATSTGPT